MQVICQYTGVTFEASSSRQKNHPKVSALLNEASNKGKSGAYTIAKQELARCKEEGMDDINSIIERVRTIVAEYNDMKNQAEWEAKQRARAEEKERQANRLEQRRERMLLNDFLNTGGYHWRKIAVGSDDEWRGRGSYYGGVGEFDHYEWELYGPDGLPISVTAALQAMAENGYGEARTWLEKRGK